MNIVNRQIFLALPVGIVYSKYESLGMIGGLYQKIATYKNDWVYQSFLDCVEVSNDSEFADTMFSAEQGKEFAVDLECGERDGSFNDNDMFVIYSKEDINKLVSKLSATIAYY